MIVGNSFAIRINKTLCRLLRIDNTTKLEVRVVDGRLIFDIVGRRERQLTRDELFYLQQHVERSSITAEQFARLSDGEPTLRSFHIICSVRGYVDPELARRLLGCFERRRVIRESWDATIDAVLAGIPGPISDDDFHSIPPGELASRISTKIDEDNRGGPTATARAEFERALVQQALDGARDEARFKRAMDADADDTDDAAFNKPLDESLYTVGEDDEPSLDPVSITF